METGNRISASNEALSSIYSSFQTYRAEKRGMVDVHMLYDFLARPDVKTAMQKLLEVEDLPLDGFDLIPIMNRAGQVIAVKGYINQTGAGIKAQRWVESRKSSIIGYLMEILEMPGPNNNGRAIIKSTLTVRDNDMYLKVLDKAEKLEPDVVKALLEGAITKVQEIGAHSYAMEQSDRNKTPEAIIKKAATQGYRRAHLKLAKPTVRVDEDNEEREIIETKQIEAQKETNPASEPLALLAPTQKVPEKDPKKVYAEIKLAFKNAGKGPAEAIRWLKEKHGIESLTKANLDQLEKALVEAQKIALAGKAETPKSSGAEDATKAELLKKLFEMALDKLGLSAQSFEAWAVDMWGNKPQNLTIDELESKLGSMQDM